MLLTVKNVLISVIEIISANKMNLNLEKVTSSASRKKATLQTTSKIVI